MKILDIPRSGSYAGLTSSKNRFGQYVRNRRSPVQPIGTGRRAFIRTSFGAASAAWAALTPDQQASWDGWAESHPIVNSLGASVVLTGHQMFVAVGTQRFNIGSGLSNTPPDSAETATLTAITFTASADDGLTVEYASDAPTDKVLVAFSPQLSPGRRFPTRFWQATLGSNATSPVTVTPNDAYIAEFGGLTVGARIFVKLTPVNAGGWTGVPSILSAIVAPPAGP